MTPAHRFPRRSTLAGASPLGWSLTLSISLAAALAAPAARAETTEARAELSDLMDQAMRQDNFWRAWYPNAELGRQAAIGLHGQVLETNWKRGYLVMQLDADQAADLRARGFRLEPASDFMARRDRMLTALRRASSPSLLGQAAADREARDGISEAIPNFSCYETVEETFAAAQGFTATYPKLAQWTDVGSSWERTQGKGGYPIYVLKLTNQQTSGPNGGDKPKLFVQSAIHAREYATAPLVLAFARQLLSGYGKDADATWILDHHEIHLMLQMNPDGRKKAETGLFWRKNTNQAYCGANSNNRGADLNRNYNYSWNVTHGQGSSGNPCDETFRGPSQASEPETQASQNYARQIWADRRGPKDGDPAPADTSGIHLDIHSYGQLVLWPWGHTNTPSGNTTAAQTLGRRFAFLNGHYPEQAIGLYPTDGTSDGASYGDLGVAAYTFEIGTNFFQSCTSYESQIKPGNLLALMYAAKVVRAPYQTPAGPDVYKLSLSDKGDVPAGTPVTLSATATDKHFSTANGREKTDQIKQAEAYIDTPPWLAGAVALPIGAADGRFNGKTERLSGVLPTTGLTPGKHLVYLRAFDTRNQAGPFSAVFLTIR